MKTKRSTRSSLVASIVILALTFSMLVGTTFAWFTDSVTSAGNIIKSGTLEVEMLWADGAKAVPDTDSDDWNDASSGAMFNHDKWEPGYVEVKHVKISNLGTLALKYQVSIIANGEVSDLSDVIDVYYLDPAQAVADRLQLNESNKLGSLTTVLSNMAISGYGELDAGENDTVTIALKMREDAGNDYQNKSIGSSFSIVLFATQNTVESDSFDNMYDEGAVIARSQAEAQAALDKAAVGTTLYLVPGVDYGTLVFRQSAASRVVDITDAGGDAPGNEKYRRIEDLSIIGAVGAELDGFDFQVSWIGGSGASYIDVKNLSVEGVSFSGEATPFNFDGAKGSALGIDGLTIKNCKMNDADGNNRFVFQQITGYKTLNDKTTGEYVMTAGIKNLTITGCDVSGAYMVIESRAMENLTITNNNFSGIKQRDMLINQDTTNYPDITYTGTITITGNTSTLGEERFVRGDGFGDAVAVIKDNVISNYLGKDSDFIKVTNANNLTVENNILVSIGAKDAESAQKALDNAVSGATIQLQPGVNYGKLYFRANPGNANTALEDIADAWAYNYNRTIENITIIGAEGAKVDGIIFETGALPGDCNNRVTIKNLVIDGIEFTDALSASSAGYNAPIFVTISNSSIDGLTVKNCKLIGDNSKLNLVYLYGADGSKNVNLINNTVSGIARLCELRGTENVTISGNVIKNTYEHAILLAGGKYSGNITVTGNTAEGIGNRFVRMAGANNSIVVIKDNVITNYLGKDADYIKITDGFTENFTIENNTISYVASDVVSGGEVISKLDVGVQLPEGLAEGNYSLTVNNAKTEKNEETNETYLSLDIDLSKDGVKVEKQNGVYYTVSVEVGKNLFLTGVTHNGEAVSDFSYDPETGIVTFATDSFSPFAISYKADTYRAYTAEDIQAAIKLGGTIILQNDIAVTKDTPFTFTQQLNGAHFYLYHNDVVLDLNGYNISVDADAVMEGKSQATALFLVRYSNLTIKGEGTISTNNQAIAVYGWAHSNINIYGGKYVSNAYMRHESDIYVNNSSVTINVYGGDFSESRYSFNTHNTSAVSADGSPVIILHEGISYSDFFKGTTDLTRQDFNKGTIALADGCTIVSADGVNTVVKTVSAE